MSRSMISSAVPADVAERMSDRSVADMPMPKWMRDRVYAQAMADAREKAYAGIRDADHIGDILNNVRDGEGKNVEFDSQLARLLSVFPVASRALASLPGNAPEPVRIALEAMLQATCRIERLLYAEAYNDEVAALDNDQ